MAKRSVSVFEGKHVCITGAGSGIGKALVTALLELGYNPHCISCLDLTCEPYPLDSRVKRYRVDCGDESWFTSTLQEIESQSGPIQIYIGCAGVGVLGEASASNSQWKNAFEVNVMQHIWAARFFLSRYPRAIKSFSAVASAAGYLGMAEGWPYGVSKAACVSFLEQLSMAYKPEELHVGCVVPLGVRTNMFHNLEKTQSKAAKIMGLSAVLPPGEVASTILEGISEYKFWISSHSELESMLRNKYSDIDGWVKKMRQLRARI